MSARAGHRWRQLGLVAVLAQLVLQLLWYLLIAPPTRLPLAFVLSLALLPSLLPLLVMRWNFERGLLWAGVGALAYFSHGVMEAWTVPAVRALALTEALLAVALIAALTQAALVEKRTAHAGG